MSAPLTLASAIAARTKRMKIGTAVQVLPLCHPLRLAEEVATVDQISQGRLIFGVGRSGFPRTYEAYGVPYGESRDRFAETLEILKRAWTEPHFSYKGKYYSFENVAVTPKPYQKPWPEIRVAANSADTFPAIAKARPCGLRRGPAWHARRTGAQHQPPIARPGRKPGIPARARYSCAPRSISPTPTRRRCGSPKKASCTSIAISASGLKICDPRRGAGRRGPRRTRPSPAGDHL